MDKRMICQNCVKRQKGGLCKESLFEKHDRFVPRKGAACEKFVRK